MTYRLASSSALVAAFFSSLSLFSPDANACGGCFVPPPVDGGTQSTLVTAHRMAFSISKERTVLWDQIQYAGATEEFAWVLPVKAGAYLDLASDTFFDTLDGATSAKVVSKTLQCPAPQGGGFEGGGFEGGRSGCGFGCAASGEGSGSGDSSVAGSGSTGSAGIPPITVTHQESIGPYETVTIHSNVPGALYDWLDSHGYNIEATIEPVVNAYEDEGFDFIALRLIPGIGVQQMQPVRIVTPGASAVSPLRMVAAGKGANVAELKPARPV